jgi:hypothetical protein
MRVFLVHCLLQVPPQEELWWRLVWRARWPQIFRNELILEEAPEHIHCLVWRVARCSVLLVPTITFTNIHQGHKLLHNVCVYGGVHSSLKNSGPTILRLETAHHTKTFCEWSGTWCSSWGFSADHKRVFWEFTYPFKWNQASSAKNVVSSTLTLLGVNLLNQRQ